MALPTRKPTGNPGWDLMLLAAGPKCGKSFTAAQACCSDYIGRALWWSWGEADPEEYGAMPGSKMEIVNYQDYDPQGERTYQALMSSVRDALREERVDGKPTLWVFDSGGRMWGTLSDQAQFAARVRAARKASPNKNEPVEVGEKGDVGEEAQIHSDLWNSATDRWYDFIDLIKQHNGPVILTALLKEATIFNAAGQPTKQKEWKVEAQKNLPADVGVVVEIPRLKEAYVTGVRSLRFEPVTLGEHTRETRRQGFTVEKLWEQLGWIEHDARVGHSTVRRMNSDPDGILRAEVGEAVHAATARPLEERLDALREVWEKYGQQTLDGVTLRDPDGNPCTAAVLIKGWVHATRGQLARAQEQPGNGRAAERHAEESAAEPVQQAPADVHTKGEAHVQQQQQVHAQQAEPVHAPAPAEQAPQYDDVPAGKRAADAAQAQVEAQRAAVLDVGWQRLMAEIEGQAAVLGISPREHVKSVLAAKKGAKSVTEIPLPIVHTWVIGQRERVVHVLREQGNGPAAAAYASVPDEQTGVRPDQLGRDTDEDPSVQQAEMEAAARS